MRTDQLVAPAPQEMTPQVLHLVEPHPAARLQDFGLKFFLDLNPSHPTCISENQAFFQ